MQPMNAAEYGKLLALMGWTPAAAAAWRADLARRHADYDASPEAVERAAEEAAIIADAKAKRAASILADRAARDRESVEGIATIRAPYSGAVIRRFRVAPPIATNDVSHLERLMSTGGL